MQIQFLFPFLPSFYEGQRVRYIGAGVEIKVGETGVITKLLRAKSMAVDWDKSSPARHDCGGRARNGHGWVVYQSSVEPVNKERTGDCWDKAHDGRGRTVI